MNNLFYILHTPPSTIIMKGQVGSTFTTLNSPLHKLKVKLGCQGTEGISVVPSSIIHGMQRTT